MDPLMFLLATLYAADSPRDKKSRLKGCLVSVCLGILLFGVVYLCLWLLAHVGK